MDKRAIAQLTQFLIIFDARIEFRFWNHHVELFFWTVGDDLINELVIAHMDFYKVRIILFPQKFQNTTNSLRGRQFRTLRHVVPTLMGRAGILPREELKGESLRSGTGIVGNGVPVYWE